MPICSSCGAENPEGFRFCGSCAAPLVLQEPGARELRKTVTIVFCDVTGSTALGERLDPESLRRVLLRYFESMERVVVRRGGTVEKFAGDAVMAVSAFLCCTRTTRCERCGRRGRCARRWPG